MSFQLFGNQLAEAAVQKISRPIDPEEVLVTGNGPLGLVLILHQTGRR